MAEDSDLEKTEPASPRRLEKARDEGQVARSRELGTFLALLSGIGGLSLMAHAMYVTLRGVVQRGLRFDAAAFRTEMDWLISAQVSVSQAFWILVPIFALVILAALFAAWALGGGVWSLQTMVPKPERLNPLKGFKRMLGTQTWVELGKTLAKTLLVTLVGVQVIFHYYDDMLALSAMAPEQALISAMRLVALCCAWIAASLLFVVIVDVPWQLWHHGRQLRMSREDVRQEHKESEGDPQLKGQIRQKQRAMAFNRMMSAVPSADVIITNPTHYAVALRYGEGQEGAPRVVAKGAGYVARRIRSLAHEHAVPQLQSPALARAIYYSVALDQEIPVVLYQSVAEVLAWVYQVRLWRAGRGRAPAVPDRIAVPPGLDPLSRHSEELS